MSIRMPCGHLLSKINILQMYHCFFLNIGEFIPYRMEDMDWCGYEDEETGEWYCSLIVVYDPATSNNLPKQRWHRATDKINQVNIS